ncbi:MAG: hypothetical protein HY000_41750 [Planctomycetes bacterium]|nr:hypothetical protein [Planctomycetota bacterium]
MIFESLEEKSASIVSARRIPSDVSLLMGRLTKPDPREPDDVSATSDFPSIQVPSLYKSVREFNIIVEQISELSSAATVDDEVPPTIYAFQTTLRLLIDACHALLLNAIGKGEFYFPKGYVVANGDGGIRVEWIRDDASVRLAVPSAPQGTIYIYHEAGSDFGADKGDDVTGVRLAQWLKLVS